MNSQVVSRQRVVDHGEVYTHEREVKAMLDLVKDESYALESKFLEPSCGNGNFLVEILRRKLSTRRVPTLETILTALSSIYAIELLKDNVEMARKRLYDVACEKLKLSDGDRFLLEHIINHNIIWGNTLEMRTADTGQLIEFCEWEWVDNKMVIVKKHRLIDMLERDKEQLALFGE